ncbi:histidine phosphatase family protein [Mycetocola reblochoni]|uniref:histidine phosphatase family protein n=1 Tax=Mycetocola reblochoni TaxID=331618 RepID=UPI001FE944A5|nr:histidine phosphatase family protein [Mycetocola reblochoni]
MTLGFVRHGQTDWNLAGRLQGSSDIPLNDTGRQQARDAVEVLRDHGDRWSAVVSSPLSRARETAEIIADGLGLELGPSYHELIERDYGEAEGVVEAEVERSWPGKSAPFIERLESVVGRGLSGLERVAADYPDADVVVVCHGTIIRYTLAEIAGRELPPIRNGAVSTVEHDGAAWDVTTVNDLPL